MNRWLKGPMEKAIAPPIKNAIAIYLNNSPIVVYVGTSAFTPTTAADIESVKTIAQVIVDSVNG